MNAEGESQIFDLSAALDTFPEAAETMLVDVRLTDRAQASARLFRVYRPLPAHYHAGCDEYLMVLCGRGRFFIGEQEPFEASAGRLIFFKQGVVHGLAEILEAPLVFLAIDAPRRDPADIHFVDPASGTAEIFIRTQR